MSRSSIPLSDETKHTMAKNNTATKGLEKKRICSGKIKSKKRIGQSVHQGHGHYAGAASDIRTPITSSLPFKRIVQLKNVFKKCNIVLFRQDNTVARGAYSRS